MQLVTKLNRQWTRFTSWIQTKVENRVWKEQLETALSNLSEQDKHLFEPLLNNQVAHLRSNPYSVTSATTRRSQLKQNIHTFNTAVHALHTIKEVRAIVGVQPMRGPVNFVYSLQYGYIDEPQGEPDPLTGETPPRRIRLHVQQSPVEARTRKLKTGLTLEAQQDLLSQHGLDIEEELRQVVGDSVAYEIIAEMLQRIKEAAVKVEPVKYLNLAIDSPFPESTFDTMSRLLVEINMAANNIAARTRRGAGNFVIASPTTVAMLQAMPGSVFAPAPKDQPQTGSILRRVGVLNGTMVVYCNATETSDDIIVGYKGSGETDAGLFYTPYVPLFSMGIVVDPLTFQPKMSFATRAGTYELGAKLGDEDKVPMVTGGAYYAVLNLGAAPKLEAQRQAEESAA